MLFNHQVHDPYAVFRSSTTPVGLYARQKWLDESSTQHVDGSWGASQRQWYTFLAVHALRNKGIL
jgi:hypothetical protein